MNDRTKLAALLNDKYNLKSTTLLDCFYDEDEITDMLNILQTHPEIIDKDEVYTVFAKVTNTPCKPVNDKLKCYMKKWGVKERTQPWCKD